MKRSSVPYTRPFLMGLVALALGCSDSSGTSNPTDSTDDDATEDGDADGSSSSDDGASDGGDASGADGASGDGSASDGSAAGDGDTGGDGATSDGDTGVDPGTLDKFSFFVTSLKALQDLSGSQQGFGGDLSYGETGAGAGLRGADKICADIAERSMPGASAKEWRAFLSAVEGEDGNQVDAIDRIGAGPWYDRLGRLVANNLEELAQTRPSTADTAIKNDLPNEDGVPNHNPDGTGEVDNHDMLTGTGTDGRLYRNDPDVTCNDWTSAEGSGSPRVGHSWPRSGGGRPGGGGGSGDNWMSALDEAGCAPGVSLIEMGPPDPSNPTVGSGGGYGGFYCFALVP